MNDFEAWVQHQADVDERAGVQRDWQTWRRLAWDAALEAAISRIVPSQSGRGLPDFHIREIRLLKTESPSPGGGK